VRRIFFSDVHLSPDAPQRSRWLLDFLHREAPRTDEFYILGDLFNYWMGPQHFDLADYQDVLSALGELVRMGRRVVFLYGNRDFYIGSSFRDRLGVETYPGPLWLDFEGQKVCLIHGDTLCTHDWKYNVARLILRSRAMEMVFSCLPVRLARFLAVGYQRYAKRETRLKTKRELSMSSSAIEGLFRQGADVVVCGHTHRVGVHKHRIDGQERTRYSLGCWDEGSNFLELTSGQWKMHPTAAPPEPND
jgi:UDP-2,3-diacylglucosamine hydrolase